jgi:flagellar basal-body rod protein FlgF
VQAGINGQPDQTVPVVKYTRQGNFSRSSTGALQDSESHAVLDPQQRQIIIPTGDIQVSSNGTVSVVTPAGSTVVGQVGVFTFPDKRVLTADGTNRISAPDSAKPIAGTATVRQGSVEGSNEDAIQGTMQLVLVQRQTEMMQKALTVFNTDFDKVATEELPKV